MRRGGLYGAAAALLLLPTAWARPAVYGADGAPPASPVSVMPSGTNTPPDERVSEVGFSAVDGPPAFVPVDEGEDGDGFIPTRMPDADDEPQAQFHELSGLIAAEELPIADLLDSTSPLSECGASPRCVWACLSRRVRQAASRLGGEVAELGDFIAHAPEAEGGDGQGRPDVYGVAGFDGERGRTHEYPLAPGTDAWEQAPDYGHRFHPRQPPVCLCRHQPSLLPRLRLTPDAQLLMTIALAALALCSLSLWAVHHLHRRTARLSASRRPGEWEKRAAESPTTTIAESPTTVAEEIAQLREAASFVDDMVAAEEGRARRRQQQQQQQARPAPSYASVVETYDADDEGPPPYDSVANGSVVAGGFRCAPVSGSGQGGGHPGGQR